MSISCEDPPREKSRFLSSKLSLNLTAFKVEEYNKKHEIGNRLHIVYHGNINN
jgi:hypothetical protein